MPNMTCFFLWPGVRGKGTNAWGLPLASVTWTGQCKKIWASLQSLFCDPGMPSGFPWTSRRGPADGVAKQDVSLGTQLGLQRAPALPPGAALLLQGHKWWPHLKHQELPWLGPNTGFSARELGF